MLALFLALMMMLSLSPMSVWAEEAVAEEAVEAVSAPAPAEEIAEAPEAEEPAAEQPAAPEPVGEEPAALAEAVSAETEPAGGSEETPAEPELAGAPEAEPEVTELSEAPEEAPAEPELTEAPEEIPAESPESSGAPFALAPAAREADGPVKLPVPENVRWEGFVARWDAVEGAVAYSIELDCSDGSGFPRVGDLKQTTATAYDLESAIAENGAGEYYFAVRALGDGETTADSDEMFPGTSLLYGLTRLNPPKNLQWDGAWAKWEGGDNNSEYVNGYSVALFRDGDFIARANVDADSFEQNFCEEIHNGGAGSYTFYVTVLSVPSKGIANSADVQSPVMEIGNTRLDTPENAWWDADWDTNTFIARWDAVEGAAVYELELRCGEESVGQSKLVSATEADFSAEIAANGNGIYTFNVAAKGADEGVYGGDIWSDELLIGVEKLEKPQNVHWEEEDGHYIGVWDAVEGADSYFLLLGRQADEWADFAETNETFYDFTEMINNVPGQYDFQVTAKSSSDDVLDSEPNWNMQGIAIGVTPMPDVQNLRWDADFEAGSFIVRWDPVENAAGYLLIIYDGDRIQAYEDLPASVTEMNISELVEEWGKGIYQFSVAALGDGVTTVRGQNAFSSDLYVGLEKIEPVTRVWWDADEDTNSYIAKWEAVEDAPRYYVQLNKNDNAGAPLFRSDITDTCFDFSEIIENAGSVGKFDVFVVARGDWDTTGDSDPTWNEQSLILGLTVLPDPENVRWEGKFARWDTVAGAAGYNLMVFCGEDFVYGGDFGPEDTEADLTDLIADCGEGPYVFAVFAYGDYVTTASSPGVFSEEAYFASAQLAMPQNVHWEEEDGRYIGVWDAVEGADSYFLLLGRQGDDWVDFAETNETFYDFTELINNVRGQYDFQVTAKSSSVDVRDSEPVWNIQSIAIGLTLMPDVQNLRWDADFEAGSFIVRWDPVEDAAGYLLIIYKGDPVFAYENISPDVTDMDISSLIKEIGSGVYQFSVAALGDGETTARGRNVFSDELLVGVVRLATPENVRWVIEDGRYIASWDAVENAAAYSVFVAKNHEFFDFQVVEDPFYDITALIAGTHAQYDFQVVALGNGEDTLDSEGMWCEERLLFGLETLPDVENPRWDGTVARWDKLNIDGVTAYELVLWKQDGPSMEFHDVSPDLAEYDFSEKINEWGNGIYWFGIYGCGDYMSTADGNTAFSDDLYVGLEKLPAPANPVWSKTTAKWGKVAGAVSYEVVLYSIMKDNEYIVTTKSTSYNFAAKIKELGPDGYFFDVRAIGDPQKGTLDSDWAVNDNYQLVGVKMLPAPENVRWEGTTVRWDSVANNAGYMLTLDRNGQRIIGQLLTAADVTEYSFADVIAECGDGLYEVGIHTVGNTADGTCTGHGAYAEYLNGVERTYLENVRWEGYIARWDDDPNAASYDITLTRAGQALRTYKITENFYDFESLIKEYGPAVYSFELMAKGAAGYVDAKSFGNTKDFTAEHVTAITLSAKALTVGVGEPASFSWAVTPDYAEDAITLKSSKPAVCDVDADGNLHANAAGSATITVSSANGKKATCKVTVKAAPSAIVLNTPSLFIAPGEERTLTATLQPKAAVGTVMWESSNTAVAVVDNGVVTAVGEGLAEIKASVYNGTEAVCTVEVSKAPDRLTLFAEELTMSVKQPGFYADPGAYCGSEPTYGEVTLTSSNPKVLKVDASGLLTALKAGSATVTATLYNGITAECNVTVVAAPTKVTLNETKMTLKVDDTLWLEETVLAEGTPYTGAWSSSKPAVATVDEYGTVTAVAAGSATITYKTFNGKSAKCTVKVCSAPDAVTMDTKTVKLAKGDTFTLTATVSPAGFEDEPLTWTSSSQKVATVDENGTVTAIAKGKATITVKTSNGKSAKCTVTVS